MQTPFDQPKQAPVVPEREWLWIHFILMIPLVNLLVALAWVCCKRTNPSKVNYGRVIVKLYGVSAVVLIAAFILIDRSGVDYGYLLNGVSRVLTRRFSLN